MESSRVPIDGNRFARSPFPVISRPQHIGEFCIDRNRQVSLGRAYANYLYEKVVGARPSLDLNKGFDTFEQKSGEDEHLDTLLTWVVQHAPRNADLKKVLHEADFVSWRGLLTKIAVTHYTMNDPWRFAAIRRNNIIFLFEIKTEEALKKLANMTHRDKLMTYWGFKFEQYVTCSERDGEPCTSRPVTCLEEFTTVVKSSLTNMSGRTIRLVYGAEVDAIDGDGGLVEIKTQRHALEGGFWRHKSLKWWMQSFLVGIENIVVGYRNDHGIVHNVGRVGVNELPRKAHWQGSICMHMLADVLCAVQDQLKEDGTQCIVDFPGNGANFASITPFEDITGYFTHEFCDRFNL